MRTGVALGLAAALSGCTVERVGDAGATVTRPVIVKARDVAVFANQAAVPGTYSVVEEVWVKDTGEDSPQAMRDRLRVMAGARGANGLILAATNREDNTLRVDLRPTLDNPFEYYSATAIWLREGERPVRVLESNGANNSGA